jgi:two-component sensor histidine kinase
MKWTCTNNGWFRAPERVVRAYGVSVLGVGVAVVLTEALPALHPTPTVLFFAAVAAAAWLGGKGPAILATLLSILTVDFLFVHPRFSLLSSLADLVRFGAFTLVALLIWYLQDRYQRIAAEVRHANDVLELRVQERTADLTTANALLTAEIEERRRAESALQESEAKLRVAVGTTETALREKEVLLRELQHRVKNNLQIISSILSLQGSRIDDRGDRELFKECQQRVRAIAAVHEKLFRAPNLATFDLVAYLDELVQSLLRVYCVDSGAVVPKVVVEAALGIESIIPCALIVNELVCNAFKYAFPEGRSGEVRVELRRGNGQVRLTVADDGIGSPAGAPRGTGVGQQIVQSLVEQLSGRLEWGNGCGTSATVTFPEQ